MKDSPSAGFTLIEVVIGMLLIALMVGPLFSVALTARQSKAKLDKKTAATIAANRVLDRLKLYITADYGPGTAGPAPGTNPYGWGLPGDSRVNEYALASGVHNLTAATWLPELTAAGGAISYNVTYVTSGGVTQPKVDVTITWN